MAMNVEAEIRDLKRRVSEIEGSFGFLIRQVRGVHKDLLAFQARVEQRFEKVDGRLEKIGGRLDRGDSRLDRIEKSVRSLSENMPKIVSDALREALRATPQVAEIIDNSDKRLGHDAVCLRLASSPPGGDPAVHAPSRIAARRSLPRLRGRAREGAERRAV